MAQTAPPPTGENIPRPLPRGGRPLRGRDTRPRFSLLDALWMAVLAALFIGLGLIRHTDAYGLTVATGVLFLTYLVGWRSSGRPAGVISGLLLATSAPFFASIPHSLTADLFALVSIGALFSFVAGSSLIALVLAAAAVWLRADGLVLGLMLLTFALIQHRRRAWLGALLFLLPTLAAFVVPVADGGHPLSFVTFGFHSAFWVSLAAPAMLFTAWFVLPFFGEMADPIRRARWLPTVVWTCLYAVTASLMAFSHADVASAAIVPFLPLVFLLAGAGLARLLPVMTGDLPMPALRYTMATLAVVSLAAIRAHSEWTPKPSPPPVQTAPAAMRPDAVSVPPVVPLTIAAPPPSLPQAAVLKPVSLKKKPLPHKPLAAHKPGLVKPKLAVVKPKTLKPAVPLTMMKNGRMVRRSKWAIQWDLTHPH
jgi:hypothetical protein